VPGVPFHVSESGFTTGADVRHRCVRKRTTGWKPEIKAALERTRQTYGPERLQADLADNGIQVGVHRIKQIRRKRGLSCKQKRKLKSTADSNHALPVAPNRLDRQFDIAAPNKG